MLAYLLLQVPLSVDEMKKAGMSPYEIILTLAFIALVAYMKVTAADIKKERETWHNETRAMVTKGEIQIQKLTEKHEKLEEHIDICERDRVKLNIEQVSMAREMDTLKLMIATYRACSVTDCPMRRNHPDNL